MIHNSSPMASWDIKACTSGIYQKLVIYIHVSYYFMNTVNSDISFHILFCACYIVGKYVISYAASVSGSVTSNPYDADSSV